jgi:oligopeptide transport system ATP-binding protein
VTPLLEVRGLSVWLGGREDQAPVVDGVGFEVRAGQVFGLAGESGSGKTITALSLLGLLPVGARLEGSALFEGTDLLALRGREMRHVRARQIAMVFQDPLSALHPMLTVERQMTEHVRHHLGLDRADARQRAVDLLKEVRIPNPEAALRGYPHQFSGGMRQRIQIAMALACEPRLLIADEPTTALDVTVQAGILRLLNGLCRSRELAVILITHDLGVLSALADTVTVMYAGRIVEAGSAAAVITRPRHPYTKGLLDSLPHPEAVDRPLTPIPGTPASASDRPAGCAFHTRCPYAIEACSQAVPPLVRVETDQSSACIVDPFAPTVSAVAR